MARPHRIDYAGALHHVMNRGARRQNIFVDRRSRPLFKLLLQTLPAMFGTEVYGYALMPNHYHVLLRSSRGNVSESMKWLGQQFTQDMNRRHGWDGPSWLPTSWERR